MDLNRKISYAALFFVLMLGLGGAASLLTTHRLEHTASAVRHTDLVLETLDDTLSALVDVEDGSRGFELTGRDAFLAPYVQARDRLPGLLARLRELVVDHPAQEARLDELTPALSARLALAEAYIDIRRTDGLQAAANAVALGEGQASTDRARAVLDAMQTEERRLLLARTAADHDAGLRSYRVLGSVFFVAINLVLVAAMLLRRTILRRTQRLVEGLERMAAGDLHVNVEPGARDELGRLAIAFNETVRQRRIVEEELARTSARLDAVFRDSPLAIVAVDLAGHVEIWNPAAERMFGWTFDEVRGRPAPVIPDEDREAFERIRERVLMRREMVAAAEHKRLRRDGTRFDACSSAAPLVRDGELFGMMAIVEDITERKHAVEALRRSEAQFRGLIEHLPDGVLVHDQGLIVYANPALARLLGYDDAAAIVGRRVPALCHPEELALVAERIRRLQTTGEPAPPQELRMRRRDGSYRPVETTAMPIRFDDAPTVVVIARDLADRKRAERTREEALQRLRAIVDLTPVGLVLSTDGRHWEGNRRAEQVLGGRIDPLADITDYSGTLLDAAGNPLPFEALPGWRAVRGEQLEGVEMRVRRPDGRLVPILVSAASVPGGETTPATAVVAFEDITTFKELERLRIEWNSLIAHDLRQPLSSLDMYAQLLAQQTAEAPTLHRRVLQIRALARRLNRMIQDLLDVSRIEAQQLTLARKPVQMRDLVREATERIALEAPNRPIEVRVHGEPVLLDLDPDRIAQVMDNLLTNAIKYGDAETPIIVELEAGGDGVVVSVTNRGPGIAPDAIPLLFGRFQRTEDSMRRGVKGVGLGLYITRELVRAHGGDITAESHVDGTTTFRFTVPRRREEAAPSDAAGHVA